ncbi:MAG: hypothetical protein IRY97_09210, partial [Thermomicrobiaceae bacterium]|nr:hypothetical protein [Thermomicrobiaceae bacterium]
MGSSPRIDRQSRILIYGAGAVGAWLGGRLAAANLPVTLVGRPSLQEAILPGGLRLVDPARETTVQIPVVTTIAEIAHPPDLVFLTLKAYSLEAALPDLERLAADGTPLVTLQNGVGVEEVLLRRPAIERLVAGALTVSVSAPAPGVVRQETSAGGVALAPVCGEVPLDPLGEILRLAGIRVATARDYRALKWSKLLLN